MKPINPRQQGDYFLQMANKVLDKYKSEVTFSGRSRFLTGAHHVRSKIEGGCKGESLFTIVEELCMDRRMAPIEYLLLKTVDIYLSED